MRKAAAFSLVLVILSMALVGCNFNKKDGDSKEKKLELPKNIISVISGDDVEYYGIEGEKLKKLNIDSKNHIEVFSEELGLIIYRDFTDKGTDLIITDGEKEHKISVDGNIEDLLVSPGGTKLLYKYDSGDKIGYKILDLQNFKEFDFNSNLAISGENVEFLGENQLVLYGVDLGEKKSGIFLYDIENGKYTLEKPIVGAFIDYIDLIENQVILYTQSSLEGNKECYVYDLNSKEDSAISTDIMQIEYSIKSGDKVYFIGTKNEGMRSLYSIDIKTHKLDRLIYDFPKNISKDTKLLEVDGNIYFTGFNDDEEKNSVYMYSPTEKSVKLIDGGKGLYMIME
ncbi:hypothetical protein [Clostridium sp. B9]|uniref:hypothetical protein n=1 Tax=Clostridium sp. B9 TaxID=3423224 RepID=UPI003D2EB3AF